MGKETDAKTKSIIRIEKEYLSLSVPLLRAREP